MNATDRLIAKIKECGNPTVVGLDTRIEFLPEKMRNKVKTGEDVANVIYEFNRNIIDNICAVVPAIKIQSAYYEMYAHFGIYAMYSTAAYAISKGMVVMADVKRNDIGSTAEAYAAAYLGKTGYDFITVNPYPGSDGITPFVEACKQNDKGIFVLCRMSNPSASEIQNLDCGGAPLYMKVGALIENWGSDLIGENGYSAIGAVVGATSPDEAKQLRERFGKTFFLVPGYGAQGGTANTAAAAFDKKGGGAIVNNSRGIIAAHLTEKYAGMNYAKAAAAAAFDMREDLCKEIQKK